MYVPELRTLLELTPFKLEKELWEKIGYSFGSQENLSVKTLSPRAPNIQKG